MKIDAALREFERSLRRRIQGDDRQIASLAIQALAEYLEQDCKVEVSEQLSSGHLIEFLLDYYPRQEQPEVIVGEVLLSTCEALCHWLVDRGERRTSPFLVIADRLHSDFPRSIRLFQALYESVDRGEMPDTVDVHLPGDEDYEPGAQQALLSTGLDRVTDLGEVDYDRSEEEYYRIERIDPAGLMLWSREREALGEGTVGPLVVPAGALAELRVGDILHVEIAPAGETWRLLEVFRVRPGGYE